VCNASYKASTLTRHFAAPHESLVVCEALMRCSELVCCTKAAGAGVRNGSKYGLTESSAAIQIDFSLSNMCSLTGVVAKVKRATERQAARNIAF
jgi:hypothetical protein